MTAIKGRGDNETQVEDIKKKKGTGSISKGADNRINMTLFLSKSSKPTGFFSKNKTNKQQTNRQKIAFCLKQEAKSAALGHFIEFCRSIIV